MRPELGWSQWEKKGKTAKNIGKLEWQPLGTRKLGSRVERESKDDSVGDNKWCWYNQVKNKVGALHHAFHQNKFQMGQNFNIKTTSKK